MKIWNVHRGITNKIWFANETNLTNALTLKFKTNYKIQRDVYVIYVLKRGMFMF